MFNPNIPVTGHHGRDPIIIDDDDSDDDDNGGMQVEYSTRPLHHQSGMMGYRYPPSDRRGGGGGGASLSNYHISAEQEKKVRGRLREERHAALCVLMDRELLTVQALAAQETLPQARRRFLSKLMAPEDPEVAASIRADRFIIQHPAGPSSSSATVPMTVNRSIVDVHETDDAGWHRPEKALSSSSPASSKAKGKMTPDRARTKGKALSSSSSRQQQQQQRERERRRRWSGAEREE